MKIVGSKGLRLIVSSLVCLPAIVVMFAPFVYAFTPFGSYQWLIEKSAQILWVYFFSAIILLIFSKKYWMFLSFGCCAALCVFMKNMSNDAFDYAEKTDDLTIKVANFNLSSVTDSLEAVAKNIDNCEADLISLQEVSPMEDSILRLRLQKNYPNVYSMKSKEYYGMMVFSKYPFEKNDTFSYHGIPNIIGCINIDKDNYKLHFISSYLLPPFNATAYENFRGHLGTIAYKVKALNVPMITMGTYSSVPWSPEIKDFKDIGELSDSRLGFAPTFPNNAPIMFQVPYDHIFHSKHLKCLDFKTIKTSSKGHMGIEGIFQFVKNNENLSTTKK